MLAYQSNFNNRKENEKSLLTNFQCKLSEMRMDFKHHTNWSNQDEEKTNFSRMRLISGLIMCQIGNKDLLHMKQVKSQCHQA